MDINTKEPTTIDEYMAGCAPEVRERLQELREVIKAEMPPETTERISWRMPTFFLHGNVVHFAAQAKHIGLYPGSSGVEHFLPRLEAYHTSKGAIQFPLSQPLPMDLVREIVRFRVAENLRDFESKKKK